MYLYIQKFTIWADFCFLSLLLCTYYLVGQSIYMHVLHN